MTDREKADEILTYLLTCCRDKPYAEKVEIIEAALEECREAEREAIAQFIEKRPYNKWKQTKNIFDPVNEDEIKWTVAAIRGRSEGS